MAEIAVRRGLYFEEFNVGDTVCSAGRSSVAAGDREMRDTISGEALREVEAAA